jgi:hypothetical protein
MGAENVVLCSLCYEVERPRVDKTFSCTYINHVFYSSVKSHVISFLNIERNFQGKDPPPIFALLRTRSSVRLSPMKYQNWA